VHNRQVGEELLGAGLVQLVRLQVLSGPLDDETLELAASLRRSSDVLYRAIILQVLAEGYLIYCYLVLTSLVLLHSCEESLREEETTHPLDGW